MHCYLIKETLIPCQAAALRDHKSPYVACLTRQEWRDNQALFDMGIELAPEDQEIFSTKAEANYDSLTGSFSIPDRENFYNEDKKFAFALDEKGVVFIDDSGVALRIVERIARVKKWRLPCLERFLYDFLDQIVAGDQRLMEGYEVELDDMESAILYEQEELSMERVSTIRGDIRDLRNHYEQLLDLAEVLEENENGFFSEANLRYFRLYANRIERLRDMSTALRDYTMQIRDLYKTHLDVRQNSIMTVLTVVTTIFMPLTLITGWYGMNFVHMPELAFRLSYPIVILVCIAIVMGSVLFFRKKKWL